MAVFKMFKYILVCLLLSSAALAQAPTSPGLLTSVITNDTVTGTTVNKLAKLTAGKAIITATTDTDGAIGVVLSAAGLGGSAQIVTNGVVSCVFDGTATAGDYVQISNTVAGDCKDSGSTTRPATGQAIGRVLVGGAGAGTYTLALQLASPTAPTGAAGASLGGTYPNPTVVTNANMTGDVTSVGNATTLATGNAGNLNSGTLLAARMPALTGDVTMTAGTTATTLAAGSASNLNTGTLAAARGGWGATGAWGTTTPTPTCNAGSGTWTGTVINFRTVDKTTFMSVNLVLSAIGTCSGVISVTIPVATPAASGATMLIRENALTGTAYQGWVSPGSNTLTIGTMAGAGPTLASGDVFIGSMVMQNQ